MITIRRGDSKRIDFLSPVNATEEQIHKFENFLRSIYHKSVVDERYILDEEEQFRTKRLGDKPRPDYPPWSQAENTRLLDFKIINEDEIAEQIGRTPTAVFMRRGHWISRFQEWAGDRNIYENTEELVREFMNFLEEEKSKRRQERKERREEDKKKEKKVNDLTRHISSLEKTLLKQQEMIKRLPSKRVFYEEGMLKISLEIEQAKIELEKLLES